MIVKYQYNCSKVAVSRLRAAFSAIFAMWVALSGAACGPSTTVSDLSAALGSASSGDVVRIGPGLVEGSFIVPAGVRVEGAGVGETFIVARAEQPALVLNGGAGSEVSGLTVVADGGFGIVSRTGRSAAIRDARVEVPRGVGVAVEGLASLVMSNVDIVGPVTSENASAQPLVPTPTDSASHGLVLMRVGDAQLDRVRVRGFASFGGLLVDSQTSWSEGEVSEILGTGLMVHGGGATVDGITVRLGFQGFRLLPSYGVVTAAEAELSTARVEICDIEGPGLLHDSSTIDHENLIVRDNADVGLWVQEAATMRLHGLGSMVSNNGLAGVVAMRARDVTVEDAEIASTRLLPRAADGMRSVSAGDGVQVVGSGDRVLLRNVVLRNNARVGALIDLEGETTSRLSLDSVDVEGEGTQLGVIAQGGTLLPDWDVGVRRIGATVANDSLFEGRLDILEAVSPTDFPAFDATGAGIDRFGAVSPTD